MSCISCVVDVIIDIKIAQLSWTGHLPRMSHHTETIKKAMEINWMEKDL